MIWFLLIVWAAFFYPLLLKGLIPIPSDIIGGMYYPWIEQNLGPIAGIPVKNPLLTDAVSQFWIWRNWAIDSLLHGQIAIWNPYSLSGQALSPWFHTILFSPLNIFYLFPTVTTAMAAIVATQVLLSLLFSYLFLQYLTKDKLSATFGSLSYTFSSFFIGWLVWGTVSSTLAFLPLALYSVMKIKTSSHPSFKILLFLANTCALLSGHPQTYLYFLVVVTTFSIFQNILITIIPIIFFSLASTLFVTLPSVEILNQSIRSQDQFIKNNNYGFIHIFEIIANLITPGFFGTPSTNNYWGILSNYQEKLVWFGVIPFVYTISWITDVFKKKSKTAIEKWLILLLVLGLMLSTKYPFGQLVYTLHIPLLSTSPAGRGFILTILASIIMASIYFSDKKRLYFQIPFSITLGLYIFLGMFYKLTLLSYTQAKIGVRNLTISTTILVILYLFQKINFKYVRLASILILTVDLLYFSFKYTPFTPSKYFFPQSDILSSIKPTTDYYRIEREKSELLPPNMWQPYQLSSTQGYDPTLSQKYLKYLQEEKLVIDPTRFIEWKSREIPDVKNLGIKYALVLKKDSQNKISSTGLPPAHFLQSGWKLFKESGSVAVLENPDFSPPYYLDSKGSLVLKSKTDNSWIFNITTDTSNKLIVYENHQPNNWQASIDGKILPIEYFRGTFKSINLPAGSYTLLLRYSNRFYNLGLYLSGIGLIGFIIYLYIIKKHYEAKN
jgi:hypothetical protein